MNDPMVKFDEDYWGKQGKIESVTLGMEDHGIFTFCLMFDFGGTCQGFTGYSLDEPIEKNGKFIRRRGSASGMDLIMRIMRAVYVVDWKHLEEKRCWALYDDDKYNLSIIGIRALAGGGDEKPKPLLIKEWREERFPEAAMSKSL